MKKLMMVAASIFLLVGIVTNVVDKVKSTNQKNLTEVLSSETNNENSMNSVDVGDSGSDAPTAFPTLAPSPTSTSEFTVKGISQNSGDFLLDGFVYPGSSVDVKSETSLTLTTNEDANTVTNWYKDRIVGDGYNVTSFVTTKTNDDVLNKLDGVKNDVVIRVEISKGSNSVSTTITVSIVK